MDEQKAKKIIGFLNDWSWRCKDLTRSESHNDWIKREHEAWRRIRDFTEPEPWLLPEDRGEDYYQRELRSTIEAIKEHIDVDGCFDDSYNIPFLAALGMTVILNNGKSLDS